MTESRGLKSIAARVKGSKALRWCVGVPVALVVLLCIASYFFDEPLRRTMEQKMNHDLKGYSVRLPSLHVQLAGLSVTLKDLTVVQMAHPESPVASFPVIRASIHWSGLLAGRLVAEFRLDRPKVNINLKQLENEAASKVPLKDRGWQQAVEDIYPLKINTLRINDASITYIDQDPQHPLSLSHLNLQALNIRNIRLPDRVYPSSLHLDTAIFGSGRGTIDGAGNLLSQPYPGIKGRIMLEKVPTDFLKNVAARSNLSIHGGTLQASGETEYSPKVKTAHLESLTIQGMSLDYIHSQRTAGAEKRRAVEVEKAARELSNKPGILIRADHIKLEGCNLGMVNQAASKPYRVFLSDTDLEMNNFSNQFSQGPAQLRLRAKFMGSGLTTASANFRPETAGQDLDLYVKIGESPLTAMNDVLRAYGNFDVTAGVFSLVTEIHIKNYAINGYIKPFFKDMKVYDKRKDKGRSISHKMYEMLVSGIAVILENRSDQKVATRVNISGSVNNPKTSSWQIVVELIKNAFFNAMLPSFNREVTGAGKR
jgi:hypothetical protein